MAPSKAMPKPIVKRPLAGGVAKSKQNVVFSAEVQDYVLDMQRAAEFQTPNHGDVVETRAHNYQVKVEAKKYDVEQLEAVIAACSKEREDVLAAHPGGGCCFALNRQGQMADRRAYDLEMRIMQAENELGKEREQLADLESRFKAQVDLLVARVAAALAADIDEEEFYESPRTSETQGAPGHVGSPINLEDIWEGDGDDAIPEEDIRAPSVPLDKTEEGARAQDIILLRLSTSHPPPPAARVSSTSGSGSLTGPQHGAGPRISLNGGSAPLAKRLSGPGGGGPRASSSSASGKPQPFEAREGERWPVEKAWEHELADPERRHSGRKRVSGTQKLYTRASGSHSVRSGTGSDTGPATGGGGGGGGGAGGANPPSPSPSNLSVSNSGRLAATGASSGSLDLPPPPPAGKVPGPPLRKLSLKDAVKALEVARDKANALDSTPEEGSTEAQFQPLLAPRALERHPSKLKLKLPPLEPAEEMDAVAATAGHTPHPGRLSFTLHNPFHSEGAPAGPKAPGKQRSFQFGAMRSSVGEGATPEKATASGSRQVGPPSGGPKPPLAKSSFGKMVLKLRGTPDGAAAGEKPEGRTPSGPRKGPAGASIPEDAAAAPAGSAGGAKA